MTIKIVALIDALGNLVRFVLLPGQSHDLAGVRPLIQDVEFDMFLGDKAFDADWLRAELSDRGAAVVIPPKSDRTQKIDCDFHAYRWRHLVENYFCKLKAFRRIATRYEKTDQSFRAMMRTTAFISSDQIDFDSDGNFSVLVTRDKPRDGSNWLPIAGTSVGVLVRTLYHLREETLAPSL